MMKQNKTGKEEENHGAISLFEGYEPKGRPERLTNVECRHACAA